MTQKKSSKFVLLYLVGWTLIMITGTLPTVPESVSFIGFFTILITGIVHFIAKSVSMQDGFANGHQPNFRTQRPNFQARSQGNLHYDHLIRKMQLTDLSGMSVEKAATTYASFFNCGNLASKPFFSNPYVQSVLKVGIPVGPTSVAESYASPSSATSSTSGAFWSQMSETSNSDGEICSHPTCSNPVTVFDFRCFKCRNRFCDGCKGEGVTCQQCS